jgi:hypothetical protein
MITIILSPLCFEVPGTGGVCSVVVFKSPDQMGIFDSFSFGLLAAYPFNPVAPIPAAIVPRIKFLLLSKFLSFFCGGEVLFFPDIIVLLGFAEAVRVFSKN